MRLVTLTGPGGIGKTRPALRQAKEAAPALAAASYVPLAPVGDPARAIVAITRAHKVREARRGPVEHSRATRAAASMPRVAGTSSWSDAGRWRVGSCPQATVLGRFAVIAAGSAVFDRRAASVCRAVRSTGNIPARR